MFYCLKTQNVSEDFPPVQLALGDQQGALAVSFLIDSQMLRKAYKTGVFPWNGENEQGAVIWFSPPERAVFKVQNWRAPRTIRRSLKKNPHFVCSVNKCFEKVVDCCANREKTWITENLRLALLGLRSNTLSFEVHHGDQLVGGLYGVAMYPLFFAESMFSHCSGASKVAFYGMMNYLKDRGFILVDAQVDSPHLKLLGSETIGREEFLEYLHLIED